MPSIRKSTQHLFSQIPATNIPRSVFDRSHNVKTTFNAGDLVPFYVDEVLPGDSFKLDASLFARLATPIVPFMDNLYLETFFFFVPNRLLWDHWQAFNGERINPSDSTDYLVPQATATNAQNLTLWDYMGLPTNVANKLSVSALPFRAYYRIWNEWFRDENLQASVDKGLYTGDETVDFTSLGPMLRGKRHDYFTSCLPWPQKGPGVEISIGGSANLSLTISPKDGQSGPIFNAVAGQTVPAGGLQISSWEDNPSLLALPINIRKTAATQAGAQHLVWQDPGLAASGTADLSTATPISINDLRQAFQVQRLYERDARGGTRYTEILRSHFGVVSPDARLQRPEYLGGSSTRININPVQQTSGTTDTSPQGNLAAFGVAGDVFHGFSKSFVEHGIIIGLVNVRADLTYQQGIPRMWSRKGRFDYYWPALAHLGEQAVLNKEIFAQGSAEDDKVFGYQERWAEYRYFPGQITGKFRSTDPQSLDVWHLAQKFDALPKLSWQFIEDHPPVNRVVAVQDEPQFLLDSYIRLKCARPMPVYSVPGLVDHF
nr:MAG TPA: major capsid protein [Microviridae sp.]